MNNLQTAFKRAFKPSREWRQVIDRNGPQQPWPPLADADADALQAHVRARRGAGVGAVDQAELRMLAQQLLRERAAQVPRTPGALARSCSAGVRVREVSRAHRAFLSSPHIQRGS